MASERERVIAVPSLYRLDPCTKHDDYVAGCAGCNEEILSSRLQNAYTKGYKAGLEAAAKEIYAFDGSKSFTSREKIAAAIRALAEGEKP